jgi:hypothetical protein
LCTAFNLCLGQDSNRAEVTLIKGAKITGFFELINQDSFTLIINDKAIAFSFENVKKVRMLDNNTEYIENFSFRNKIYSNTRLSSISNKDYAAFSLTQTFYYNFKNNILLGAGFGIENYLENSRLNLAPFYVASKYYIKSTKASPFVSLHGGYAPFIALGKNSAYSNSHGGTHINPAFGLRFSGNSMFTEIFCGVKLQKMYIEETIGSTKSKSDLAANRLEIGVSFMY